MFFSRSSCLFRKGFYSLYDFDVGVDVQETRGARTGKELFLGVTILPVFITMNDEGH